MPPDDARARDGADAGDGADVGAGVDAGVGVDAGTDAGLNARSGEVDGEPDDDVAILGPPR